MDMDAEKLQNNERIIRDEGAKDYLSWIKEHRGKWFDFMQIHHLKKSLSFESTDIVLDAGCGVGRIALSIAPLVKSVYAIDFSEKSIEVLLEYAKDNKIDNIIGKYGDLTYTLEFSASYFTKIYAVEVFQHIHSKLHSHKLLEEFYRILKPKGICSVINYSWRGKGQKETIYGKGIYRYRFESSEIINYFHNSGFINIKCRPVVILPASCRANKTLSWIDIFLSYILSPKIAGMFLLTSGMKPDK